MEGTENTTEFSVKVIPKGPVLGMRHVQVILNFLNVTVIYINRMHVSITLVAMTNADKSNPDFPEYNWNEQQKSYILSSFYLGYVFTQILGAYTVRRFGVKISLFVYTFLTALLSLLVPFSVSRGGWQAFSLIRFLHGIVQGGFYPALLQHLATWSPPEERTLFVGFAHTGLNCGAVAAMGLSGVIATSSWGWPGMFYISAATGFIWCALWQLFGANNYKTSRFITKAETLFIEDALKSSVNFQQVRIPVPWRAIFTSKPIYALLVARATCLGGFITIETELPSYLNGVLKLNISDNSLYSALPALASWIFFYVLLYIADLFSKRSSVSVTTKRKCFNTLGTWVPAIGIITIGFLDESHKILVIITMILVSTTHSIVFLGSAVSAIDMAPNHTNMIISIVNTISPCMVIIGPLFVGIVVNNEENRSQWQIVFGVIAVAVCIGDVAFLIWGTSKEQPWNAINYSTVKNNGQQAELTDLPFNTGNGRSELPVTHCQGNSFKNFGFDINELSMSI